MPAPEGNFILTLRFYWPTESLLKGSWKIPAIFEALRRAPTDGSFVAERAGTYVITAASGEQAAVASVVVTSRNAERELEPARIV